MDWSIILSGVSLTGVIGFIGMLLKKGREDGKRDQIIEETRKDIDGIGSKLQRHIEKDERLVSDLRIEINAMGKDMAIMKSEFSYVKNAVQKIGEKMGVSI